MVCEIVKLSVDEIALWVISEVCVRYRDENDCVVRPLPQVKRNLSEPVLLYQIVQLLLTYDPAIVQRVASLLLLVMQVLVIFTSFYTSKS